MGATKDTAVDQLARFVERASYDQLSPNAVEQLKIRILDAVGCAIGAQRGEPIAAIRQQIAEFGGAELTSLIGGGKTAPDRAAFYNSALVRYLDFNDSYLAPHETCHPSDNLGAVLAGVEYAHGDGRDLLAALAVAYQVQCRLSDNAPVRDKGFDHTVHGQYAAAAGVAKALKLDADRIAHAIAISATAHNALRVTRTGELSHWKGLASAETAFTAAHSAFLAMRGITGPPAVFEGNKGFTWSIAGQHDAIDWPQENLERVTGTIVKRFNAEVHSQATLEGVLELKREHGIDVRAIDAVEIDTFNVAFNIIGGGEEGDKMLVRRKEEADHSLPYMVAVALLDDQVLPPQYDPRRINRRDVQILLRKVKVQPNAAYSKQFPQAMPCDIRIRTAGTTYEKHKDDYEGFHTRPMTRETAEEKFHHLAAAFVSESDRKAIVQLIVDIEAASMDDLYRMLRQAGATKP